MRVDVAVVGGGPAGVAAATTLARAGREVIVVDKATFPRDKCCGDGLTTGALRQLEQLGLEPASVPSWQPVRECWIRSPSGRTVDFPLPADGVFAAIARRVDLDLALLELARAAGAKVHDGHGLTGLAWSDAGVTLSVEGLEPVSASYAVAADGMWSSVRRTLGQPAAELSYLGEWHAFRQYFADAAPLAERLWVWFEPDLLPGYAWSFPLPDRGANVGFGIRRRAGEPTRSMGTLWRALLARPHVADTLGPSATPEAPRKAWPIPARLGATALSGAGGRVLFVGDAARATDPMTGEGIGQALETGRRAAEAVLAAGPRAPEDAARHYQRQLKGMTADHRFANLLSRCLHTPRRARGAVRIAGATPWTRRNFARWMFEDYPRAVVVTPRRWQRGVLSGSGAFKAP